MEVMLIKPRRFRVEVEAGTRVLCIMAQDFREVVERLPAVRKYFERYVALKWT
jgi:hypothetical protein